MEQHYAVTPTLSSASPILSGKVVPAPAPLLVERLPFTIKRVQTADDMRKAVQVRHAAYARHVPAFAATLVAPEACDYDDDSIVLLAESKLDGSPLGSTRIQRNRSAPLHVESSLVLPAWLQGARLAEVTRLGIDEGRVGRLVKIALIKACFAYCEQHGIDYAVVTGRAPIDRQYEQLLFRDVFEDKAYVPLRHVGNIAHRVMAFEIATGEARWSEANHPLLQFFRHTHHPDIDIGTDSERQPATRRLRSSNERASTPVPRVLHHAVPEFGLESALARARQLVAI